MIYSSGYAFEEAVFGCHSGGNFRKLLTTKYLKADIDFGRIMRKLISHSSSKHPDSKIGESLYLHFKRELKRLRIKTNDLIFVSTIGTNADFFLGTDGFLYLPHLYPSIVTIDAFNIDPNDLDKLKDHWIDTSEHQVYKDEDFQSDLFRYKKGVSEWRSSGREVCTLTTFLHEEIDFRQQTEACRPENHFILTPSNISSYSKRKDFARMVARYFGKVSFELSAKVAS